MQLIFGNPLGWWGLLMLPAIVLIHCLQRTRKPVIISTLFLVQSGSSERRGGREFVFWKHSIAFWLQVLAALLITWLLLQPRWIGPHTTQRIALVLDSSLSMEASRERALEALATETATLAKTAAQTDWLLLQSDPRSPILYSGADRAELLRAAAQWQPSIGTHDWSRAIGVARSLAGPQGAVIFVTDHVPTARPYQMAVLSLGQPLQNVGFAGLQISEQGGQTIWRTLVNNYSDAPVRRQWWIENEEGQRTEPRTIELPANAALALSGIITAQTRILTLVLEADAFTADDRLPMVRPQQKQVSYRIAPEASAAKPLRGLLGSFAGTLESPSAQSAAATAPVIDLEVTESLAAALLPLAQSAVEQGAAAQGQTQAVAQIAVQTAAETRTGGAANSGAAYRIILPAKSASTVAGGSAAVPSNPQTAADAPSTTAAEAAENASPSLSPSSPASFASPARPSGQLVAAEHPLNEGLNWNGLILHGEVRPHQLAAGEIPLLWQGQTPLIWLRQPQPNALAGSGVGSNTGGALANGYDRYSRDLVFNFQPERSNAFQLPATVLLISRFVDELRAEKPAYEAANVELGQRLRLSLPRRGQEVHVNGQAVSTQGVALHLSAPPRPSLTEVTAGGEPLLLAAAHFADVREADLRNAASHSDLPQLKTDLITASSEADAGQAWWLLLLAAAMMASWFYAEKGR